MLAFYQGDTALPRRRSRMRVSLLTGVQMDKLMPHAEKIAAVLKARNETISVAESSAGGLISAALLAVPGASAYFIGGGVLYTRKSLLGLMSVEASALEGITPGTEASALMRAQLVRKR